ncbi:MFS transporter [Variovorax sp. YR216]|uniref:MFS transporter n=1 Tax=Variovorax sp. YR216 TaxID=1882828 RepID=UPI00089C2BE5|nr:MFS transporter [Variovorax sp. YR216]SEA86093.1 Predicted arabinose efflux permease, MFS family [Variovorax sp. YR216]
MQKSEVVSLNDWSAKLWLVGCCAFTSMASMRICDAMLPALAQEFAATAGQAARAISAFALAYGVLQLFYGPLGDRFGKVKVIGLATLACTVGSALAAASPNLEWLVASRALSGAAAAGIIPLTMAWIGDSVAYEDRQAVLAQLLGATVFGMITGQWAGGLLADAFGWRSAFVGLAAIFAVSGALLVSRVIFDPRVKQCAPMGLLNGIKSVVGSRWPRVVLLVTAIEGALAFSALAFIPSDLHLRFGLSMPTAGGVVALYGIGGLSYSRTARRMLRRWGETGLARIGGIATAAAFGTMALAPSWYFVPPACFLAGFGFYALHNTLQTNATQMAPWARGTAVSLFACSLFLGQSIGVLGAAWLVDQYTAPAVYSVSAIGLLLLGLSFAVLVKRRGRP